MLRRPQLLFVEPDHEHLCLNIAYRLETLADYAHYRTKALFQERFHHAQLLLASPIVSASHQFSDPEVQALFTKTTAHLRHSPVFRDVDLGSTDFRLFLLQAEISRAKTREEYRTHPLAKKPY